MNYTFKKLWLEFTDRFGTTPIHPQYIIKKYERDVILDNYRYVKGALVDIGCGTQPYKHLVSKYISRYVSVDHPKISKMYPSNKKPNILSDAENLPFADAIFDTALLLQVLEHLRKPEVALKEVIRILKKDGILIISVPFMYPLHDQPHDFYRFTHYALKQILADLGLKILKLYPQGTFADLFYLSFIEIMMYQFKKMMSIKNNLQKFLLLIVSVLVTLPLIFTVNLLFFLLNYLRFMSTKQSNYLMPINYVIIARKL